MTDRLWRRPASEEPPLEASRVGRVLVVDDDPQDRGWIAEVLRDRGHLVREAEDGPSALRAVADRVPDVVVLDVLMAGMNGIEVCSQLRARHTHLECPVIFLTGLTDETSRLRCLRAGGNEFVSRPTSEQELLLRVGNLVQLKTQHDLLASRALQLEATVAARTAQLRSSQEEAIARLATAVELRDGITAQLGMRVGGIAALIGEELGFSTSRCDVLRVATTMHDVGKGAIPDRILMKPGRLTGPEYELMKRHTSVGERLIRGGTTELLRMAALVAGAHHERMDGSGYPRGLRGADIPLEGRIAAVADVFDATSTPRRYRAEIPVEQCVGILREGQGRLFDEEVVDAFVARLPQVLELAQESGVPQLRRMAAGQKLPVELDLEVLNALLEERLPEPDGLPTAPRPPAAHRALVLVVDDEPMLRTMLVEMLSEEHDVVGAASADEAEALLHRPFDAILCDLAMPHRSGIQLHRWIGEHRPNLHDRVVFMTGGCFTTEAREYLASHTSLEKPFSEEEVLAALRVVLTRGKTR